MCDDHSGVLIPIPTASAAFPDGRPRPDGTKRGIDACITPPGGGTPMNEGATMNPDRIEFVIAMLEAMRREGIEFDVALRVLRSGFGLDPTNASADGEGT